MLKCLAAQDLLRSTSCVSQQWLRLSNSHEVWNSLCDSVFISPADLASCQHSPKLAYQRFRDAEIFNLVLGNGERLKLFDCRTQKTSVEISCSFSTEGSAVMLRDNEVFLTGNGEKNKEAFLVNFSTSLITNYPDSLDNRRYHGSAHIQSTVFLFGGDCENCFSAEKCNLPAKEWSWLPAMPVKRSAFTPCVRKRSIYLCGGNVSVCHVFHSISSTYEELPLTLPGKGWCVATFVDPDLVLENAKYRSKWRSGEQLQTFTPQGRSGISP